MALVTITATIPDTAGDADLWPWRVTEGATVRNVYPNRDVSGTTLTFTAEGGATVIVRNPVTGVQHSITAATDDLFDLIAEGTQLPTPATDVPTLAADHIALQALYAALEARVDALEP